MSHHHFCWKLGLRLGNQLQFKCDSEQNTFRNLTLASKVNLWKCVEIVQHSMKSQESALCPLRPKVEIRVEHSSTQVFDRFKCIYKFKTAVLKVTSYGLREGNQNFGGIYCLHLQSCTFQHVSPRPTNGPPSPIRPLSVVAFPRSLVSVP
jgi:hypothetical protein